MNSDDAGKTLQSKNINTDGSAYVEGAVHTDGGDFIGRDKHVHVYTRSDREELESFVREAVLAYERHLNDLVRPEIPVEPYKFLLPFGLKDQDIFFGRDKAIDDLYQTLFKARLTVLHARSGAGKSSLLNAGLGPRLSAQRYLPLFARTYNDPVTAIINEIVNRGTPPHPRLLPVLPLREFLHLVVTNMGRGLQELVIVLDQFEEIFTTPLLPEERSNYMDALADCIEDEGLPLRLVLSIRGDYFSQLAEFSERWPTIFHNQFLLQPMQLEEVKSAITGPVNQVDRQVTYDEALLETLLAVLSRDQMDLPELQILCTQLYELAQNQRSQQITLDLYTAAGGAQGILSGYLEQALTRLPPEQRPLAWHLLTTLIDSEGRRRVVAFEADQFPGSEPTHLQPVLNCLIASRLAQRHEDGRYELVHDYLAANLRDRLSQTDLAEKQVRELLQREVISWQANCSLIARDRLEFINEQRSHLVNLSAEETELLLRSAVDQQFAVDIWALAAHRQGLDIWPILQPALAAADYRLRASLVAILPVVGEAALPGLTQALSDPIPLVRVQAIKALEQLNSAAARQALTDNLQYECYIPPDDKGPAFYIDRYPVTNAAYELFLQHNPSHQPPDHWSKRSAPPHLQDHPVVGVSWSEAQAYAAWASKRLPTAMEWYRAAGGSISRRYPWGNFFNTACSNTREGNLQGTTPVGFYSPAGDSPYQVADLAGNVWEWLADEAGPRGEYRRLRGGSWFYSADFARVDYDHFWRKPTHQQNIIGFRLCFDLRSKEGE